MPFNGRNVGQCLLLAQSGHCGRDVLAFKSCRGPRRRTHATTPVHDGYRWCGGMAAHCACAAASTAGGRVSPDRVSRCHAAVWRRSGKASTKLVTSKARTGDGIVGLLELLNCGEYRQAAGIGASLGIASRSAKSHVGSIQLTCCSLQSSTMRPNPSGATERLYVRSKRGAMNPHTNRTIIAPTIAPMNPAPSPA